MKNGQDKLNYRARFFYYEFCEYVGDNGSMDLSVSALCRNTGIARATVDRYLDALRQKKWIMKMVSKSSYLPMYELSKFLPADIVEKVKVNIKNEIADIADIASRF